MFEDSSPPTIVIVVPLRLTVDAWAAGAAARSASVAMTKWRSARRLDRCIEGPPVVSSAKRIALERHRQGSFRTPSGDFYFVLALQALAAPLHRGDELREVDLERVEDLV